MEPLMSTELHIARAKGKRKRAIRPVSAEALRKDAVEGEDGRMLDSKHLLISMLLPPAVRAFFAEIDSEVAALVGDRYRHAGNAVSRWGSQRGSIVMGNQHVAVDHPRVRDRSAGKEVQLETYRRFQDPELFNETVFSQGLKHVSARDYEKGLPKIAASFGVSKSSVSRSWVNSTRKQVERLLKRDLGALNIVAVFIDGKRFAKLGVVVAMGVGQDGKKHVLGIYQSSTENSAACVKLIEDLERRGLPERELLFVVDGGSGLNKALAEKYRVDVPRERRAVRVRCYVHKWRNLEGVLDEKGRAEAAPLFWALRDARDSTMAKACSDALEACLKRHNVSALASFQEAKADLLAIHELKLGATLRKFFSTTNPIESLNSLLEEDLRRVKRWRDSEHFQRWLATACLHNEKRMRRIRGHSALPALVVALAGLCAGEEKVDSEGTAA